MVNLPLQDYLKQVKELIQSEQGERAIGMCQHALRSFPRCVELYALLGQACLETDRPDDAGDMFRRVLGADPENFIARVGLGVVAEGIGAVDEAVWQWERALELEPHHPEVREELKRARASQKQNGNERIKLSRVGLGRIYLRGEQYEKAASEFRVTLNSVPVKDDGSRDRFDIEVALAEALYRGGHTREAADVCSSVLKVLPNALKPNLILGDIYHETGRDDEATALFDVAQGLDPENRLAAQLLNPPAALPLRPQTIETPGEDMALVPAQTEAPAQPSLKDAERALPWLTPGAAAAARAAAPQESAHPASAEAAPDWLRALQAGAPAPTATPADIGSGAAVPDWLKTLSDEAESGASSTAPAPTVEPADAAVQMPDWLKALSDLRGAEPPVAAQTAPGAETPATAAAGPSPVAEAPSATGPAAEAPAAELPATPVAADVQAATGPATTSAPPAAVTPTRTAEEAPAAPEPTWLTALRAKEAAAGAAPESGAAGSSAPAVPQPPARTTADRDLLPDWLRNLSAAEPEAPATVVPPAPTTREPVDYLADSSAPASIEAQSLPSGEAEQQARLDLARALRDIDLESSLELYGLMGDASEALRRQAVADLKPLAADDPQVQAIIARLQIAPETAAPLPTPSAAPGPGDGAKVETARVPDEVAKVEAPPAVPPAEATRIPREATAFLDDAAAPPSIETQAVPTGEAEYAARLDLARNLADVDLDSALEQYAQMSGASDMLVGQAVDDLHGLARVHADHARVQVVLGQLQGTLQRAPDELEQNAPEPRPPAPAEPVVSEEALEQAPAGAETATEPPAPAEPVVSEETMEPPREAVPTREPAEELDETLESTSAESTVAPSSAAQYQARLDLARAWKFMDMDEALSRYAELRNAPDALRRKAIEDVEQLLQRHPRAQSVLQELRGESTPAQAALETESPAPAVERPPAEAPPVDAQPAPTLEAPAASAPPVAGAEAVATAPAEQAAPEAEPGSVQPAEPVIAQGGLRELSGAPPAEAKAVPPGEAEFAARLGLARTLRSVDVHASAEQYKSLIGTALLPQVIDDLSQLIQEQPGERGMRVLLADALTHAGRFQEAIEQYRQLV